MTSPLPDDPDPFGLLRPDALGPVVQGYTEPRLWTPPLRPLTPETSYGFAVIEFAERIGMPLDPWQQWLVIHGGELLPDGRPRFRRLLIIVARQNGKTTLLVVLTLFWMYHERQPIVFGSSTNLVYAKEPWQAAREIAEGDRGMSRLIPKKGGIRETNGEQELMIQHPCTVCDRFSNPDIEEEWCETCRNRGWVSKSRYKIGAANSRGGRSLPIARLVADEVREQKTYAAYNAGTYAMNAVRMAQGWYISNQGDRSAVVLTDLRRAALDFLRDATGDPRLGLFEWSAPETTTNVEDVEAIRHANPNVGHRLDINDLIGMARTAKRSPKPEALTGFKTEVLCMYVPELDPAIDPGRWAAGADVASMDGLRNRLACCVQVSDDGGHATLVVAAVEAGGRVRAEVVETWAGQGCTAAVRRELPVLIGRVKPKVVGWFPNGPAAMIAADLADRARKQQATRRPWPPRGVLVEEIRAEVPAVCMGLADLVDTHQLAHPDDPLLNLHVAATQRLHLDKTWVFAPSRDAGPTDATWALAGAVHLARTLPPPPGRPRLVVAP